MIFIHDGTSETPFFNLTTAGFVTDDSVVINDNGAIAVTVTGVSTGTVLPCRCLYSADQESMQIKALRSLATAGGVGGGTADFGSFEPQISMNNLGQVAVGVIYT